MKPMKFFTANKGHLFKQFSTEFNFKAFSRLILIRISIELQLIGGKIINEKYEIKTEDIFELSSIFLFEIVFSEK